MYYNYLLVFLQKLFAIFGIFAPHYRRFAVAQTTEAPCGRTPNYTLCSIRPPDQRQGCIMGLRSGETSDMAFCEGRIATWEQLPAPSSGLTLPSFRLPLSAELLAQSPPSQIAGELYSCFDIGSLCDALKGKRIGYELCSYDPNNTVPIIPQLDDGVPLFREQQRLHQQQAQKVTTAVPTTSTTISTKTSTTGAPTNALLCKCTRKEYRMLSADELARYHNALLQLKQGYGTYEYDRIAHLHSNVSQMPGAHGGPTFVCWHREYLKRLEIALRAVDPSVCLPYWDSSLDWRLDNPADSVMFSGLLMGSSDGANDYYVSNGFLANWITPRGDRLQRYLGTDGWGLLFPLNARDYIINTNQSYDIFTLSDDTSNTACNGQDFNNVLEDNHNNVHVWVGGQMSSLETAPMDPLFFMHHCFIDYVWEQFRLKWQTRQQRETQFPPYAQINQCAGGNEFYQLNATMVPFVDPEIPNWVCLSNNYTDFLYTYSLSPSCNKSGDCGSDFLFCDTTNQSYPFVPTCCSKIKPGGNCNKFFGNSEQPCFNSTCDKNSGTCVQSQQKMLQKIEIDGADQKENGKENNGNGKGNGKGHGATTPSPTPSPPLFRLCYDNHECCSQWAGNGSCDRSKIFMNIWCPGSCQYGGCQPYPLANLPGCHDIHTQCMRWSLFPEHPGHGFGHKGYGKKQKPPPPIPMSECDRNAHFMARNCAKSCKKCGAATQERCAQLAPVVDSVGGAADPSSY